MSGSRERSLAADLPVGVTAQPIAGFDTDPGELHRLLVCLGGDAVLAGAHRVGSGVDGEVEFRRSLHVAQTPSITVPATPLRWATVVRMSPHTVASRRPWLSITTTSPAGTSSM
jgi:hypothetical protein